MSLVFVLLLTSYLVDEVLVLLSLPNKHTDSIWFYIVVFTYILILFHLYFYLIEDSHLLGNSQHLPFSSLNPCIIWCYLIKLILLEINICLPVFLRYSALLGYNPGKLPLHLVGIEICMFPGKVSRLPKSFS